MGDEIADQLCSQRSMLASACDGFLRSVFYFVVKALMAVLATSQSASS